MSSDRIRNSAPTTSTGVEPYHQFPPGILPVHSSDQKQYHTAANLRIRGELV